MNRKELGIIALVSLAVILVIAIKSSQINELSDIEIRKAQLAVWNHLTIENKQRVVGYNENLIELHNITNDEETYVSTVWEDALVEVIALNNVPYMIEDNSLNLKWVTGNFVQVAKVTMYTDMDGLLVPITYYVSLDNYKVIGDNQRF